MVLELADIVINTVHKAQFERNVRLALASIFPRAKGFLGGDFRQSIESPGRYVLLLSWETLENHTVDFRGSDLYTEWRSLVGEFFEKPPHVEHFQTAG